MSNNQKWSVTTTTTCSRREWGAKLEWVGGCFIFSLQVNVTAPAVRVILFGWSLYFGRLIVVKTHHFCPDEIAESKGWIREGAAR